MAKRSLVKGLREAPPFHKPLGVKGLLIKRSPFTSHCRAADRGKVNDYRSPFAHRACACPFLEALCLVISQCSAFGARTGRALQNCFALGRWRSNCFAIRCRAGAQAARPLASMKPQAAQPMVKRARSRLYYHWHPIGVAFGLCAGSFAVRAPCAHQRLGNASHKAKRFQKRAGTGAVGERRAIITSLSLFQKRRGHRAGLGKVCENRSPFHCRWRSHHK